MSSTLNLPLLINNDLVIFENFTTFSKIVYEPSLNPTLDLDILYSKLNLTLKIFTIDLNFPSLYTINITSGLELYADYLNRKASLMGFKDEELLATFQDPTAYPSSLATTEVDYSNMIEHKGRTINVDNLTLEEKVNLIYELPYEKIQKYVNLECIKSQQHASTPNKKLHYPEPFIASASMIHTDIAFIHILHYNYWLWFVFVFLIVFFVTTFLCTVRWCNMRTRPRRETRGVSRSKCGDLITACVPISWAASIIVSESTDASDFYDGFGSSELTIGVRAYQWGWEYYYPKNIDLNYNVKPSYSMFIGNSLKYTLSEEQTLAKTDLWRFYQNKENDSSLTPAQLILLPLDNKKIINFMDFNNIGYDTLKESSAFKKIHIFSKTFTANLVSSVSDVSIKYKQINKLHTTDSLFNLTNSYGLSRQHGFLSTKARLNNTDLLLDQSSFDKFLASNDLKQNSLRELKFYNITSTLVKSLVFDLQTKVNNPLVLDQLLAPANFSNFHNIVTYPLILSNTNDNSDGTLFSYPLRKVFNSKNADVNVAQLMFGKKTAANITNNVLDWPTYNFTNASTGSKQVTYQSSNQSFLPSDQTLRQYNNLSPNQPNFNFTGTTLWNSLTSNTDLVSSYVNFTNNNLNEDLFYKITANRVLLDAPYAPIFSTNLPLQPLNYDTSNSITSKVSATSNEFSTTYDNQHTNDIQILRGRRDGAPQFLNTAYWNLFYSNTTPNFRYEAIEKTNQLLTLNYLPTFAGYYDYDFRNLQAYELLEDLFWETQYSSYNHFDLLAIKSNIHEDSKVNLRTTMREPYFLQDNTNFTYKSKPNTEQLLKDVSTTGAYYTNSVLLDDLIQPSTLVTENNFAPISIVNTLSLLDDSYEQWNDVRSFFNQSNSLFFNIHLGYLKPHSYLNVFNLFRSDFQDFNWFSNAFLATTPTSFTNINETNPLKTAATTFDVNESSLRLSNPVTLRSTVRNSIVTYNALQKVFRSRFEDSRWHTGLSQFAELNNHQPFLTTDRVNYEKLLGKTKNNYFSTNFYSPSTLKIFNEFSSSLSSLNYHFFDFPFLLSAKSDMSRYMWFDWNAKWGMIETQFASISRYSILGVPYIRKPFDYNVETSEPIFEAENYFTRISRSRKNYLPIWTYTPYLYMRTSSWYKPNIVSLLNTSSTDYLKIRALFKMLNTYKSSTFFLENFKTEFTPSNSGLNTYIKTVWRPFSSVQSYYYTLSTLADFLTKREYLYRQYLELNNSTIHLPNELTANPTNPLFSELQASFLFNDPTIYLTEYSRESYYNSLDYFQFLIFKDLLFYLKDVPLNVRLFDEYLFFYFFGFKANVKNGNNLELYKNPYRPLRKGISSMLRLHSTGAIAIPIEIRLQVLASSRDVIHSWAIPSAGVKIDCVPGYTSHKVMVFLMEGIYWGQCMEICGRYHHWMPIVAYFMRRDLFFLWCTHFIFNTNLTKVWDLNDRQYANYVRYITYNKASWLNDLSSTI